MEELASDVKQYFDTRGEQAPEPEKPAEQPAAAPEAPPLAPEAKAEQPQDKPAEPQPDSERENLKKAVDEERSRRKEIASQLKEEIKRREEMQAKMDAFLRQAEEDRKPKPPAYEEDAAGHLKAKTEMSEAELKALRERVENFEKQTETQRQESAFRSHVQAATSVFMETKPDYADAYKHVRDVRKNELMAFGADAAVAEAEVSKWEMNLAKTALQMGKNPAEILYRTAEVLGYKVVTNKPAETNKGQEHIERLAKGQDAAKSLGTGKADSPLSLEKIAEMDSDSLEKFVAGNDWGKLARMI